jgi:hypothetical protein
MTEMKVGLDWDAMVAEHNKSVGSRSYTKDKVPMTETVHWKLGRRPDTHPLATSDRPAPSAGRFVIICSNTVLAKRVLQRFHNAQVVLTRDVHSGGTKKREAFTLKAIGHATIWGRIIFDEFHNCKAPDTLMGNLYAALRKYNRQYQWKAWALSGTPMERGLHEILIFVTLALRGLSDEDYVSNWHIPTGEQDGYTLYGLEPGVFASIADKVPGKKGKGNSADCNGMVMATKWSTLLNKAKAGSQNIFKSDEYVNLMHHGIPICECFMLRRTLKTRDPWGRRISGISGEFKTVFRPCPSLALRSTVEDATRWCINVRMKEEDGLFDPETEVIFTRHELQAIASYPDLATLKAGLYEKHGSFATKPFTKSYVDESMDYPTQGLFYNNIGALTKSSAKFKEIMKLCMDKKDEKVLNPHWSAAAEEKAKRMKTPVPPKLSRAKVLIGSFKPVAQLVTYIGLAREFGAENVLLFKGGMKKKDTRALLDRWRRPDGPFIIVASMAFAEAITLTEASTVIILEPQDRQSKQDQFLFRVYRIGQRAALCHGFILYDYESELELDILNKQTVKTVSREGLQGGSEGALEAVHGKEIDWKTDEDVVLKIDGMP